MDGLGPSKSYTLTFYGYPKPSLFTVNDAINKELQVSQTWSINQIWMVAYLLDIKGGATINILPTGRFSKTQSYYDIR